MQIIPLTTLNNEPRADSRTLAEQLGNQHESLLSLFTDYFDEFGELGFFRFEIGEIQGRGRPPKYALLNENQCYFLLTLVRNSPTVVALKLALVKAFDEARRLAAAPQPPALPTDPLELLTLSMQALQQHRQQLTALSGDVRELTERLDNTPIRMHPEMQAHVHQGCQAFGKVHPRGYSGAYRAFKEAFGVSGAPLAKYDSLPAWRFEEALAWLRQQVQVYGGQKLLRSGQ